MFDAFLVLVRALFVKALGFLEVKLAVLGATVGGSDHSTIVSELIKGQDSQ